MVELVTRSLHKESFIMKKIFAVALMLAGYPFVAAFESPITPGIIAGLTTIAKSADAQAWHKNTEALARKLAILDQQLSSHARMNTSDTFTPYVKSFQDDIRNFRLAAAIAGEWLITYERSDDPKNASCLQTAIYKSQQTTTLLEILNARLKVINEQIA